MLDTITNLPRNFSSNTVAKKKAKAIIFPILNYWFALPLEAILRIIPCPPMASPIKDCLGLVEWQGQTITVIDLVQKLQHNQPRSTPTISQKQSHSFLILTQTNSAELCGFLINQSPTLIEIPLENIRSIPSSYRQVADLSVISQMAILPQQESSQPRKIFLLGKWHKINNNY